MDASIYLLYVYGQTDYIFQIFPPTKICTILWLRVLTASKSNKHQLVDLFSKLLIGEIVSKKATEDVDTI